MKNFQCQICKNIYSGESGEKAIRMHVLRKHNIKSAQQPKHYKPTTKQISKPLDKKYDWRKWAKYPDGSRQYKEVNGKLIKQQKGHYFTDDDLRKARKKKQKQPDNQLPQVLGLAGDPSIHADGIIINLMVKIPFAFGLPTVISNQE